MELGEFHPLAGPLGAWMSQHSCPFSKSVTGVTKDTLAEPGASDQQGRGWGEGWQGGVTAVTGAPEHATHPVLSAQVAALEGVGTLLAPNLLGDGEPGHCLVLTRSS